MNELNTDMYLNISVFAINFFNKMAMKIFLTSFFFLFQLTICLKAYGQFTKREDFALPINSDQYENVFDGFHYKGNEPPLVIPSIRILIISDSLRLRSLGITKKDKPFEFFNSEPTEFLRAVYKKAGITNDYDGINIPLLINGQLITPDKFNLLNQFESKQVITAYFQKKHHPNSKKYDTPLGVIKVTYGRP